MKHSFCKHSCHLSFPKIQEGNKKKGNLSCRFVYKLEFQYLWNPIAVLHCLLTVFSYQAKPVELLATGMAGPCGPGYWCQLVLAVLPMRRVYWQIQQWRKREQNEENNLKLRTALKHCSESKNNQQRPVES